MFLERTTQDHEDIDSTLICKINVIQIKISTGFVFFLLEQNNLLFKFKWKNKQARITRETVKK